MRCWFSVSAHSFLPSAPLSLFCPPNSMLGSTHGVQVRRPAGGWAGAAVLASLGIPSSPSMPSPEPSSLPSHCLIHRPLCGSSHPHILCLHFSSSLHLGYSVQGWNGALTGREAPCWQGERAGTRVPAVRPHSTAVFSHVCFAYFLSALLQP